MPGMLGMNFILLPQFRMYGIFKQMNVSNQKLEKNITTLNDFINDLIMKNIQLL